MSSKITPYTVLGVSPHATIAEIRSAKNKLVIKPHPDKTTDETKFEELSRQSGMYREPTSICALGKTQESWPEAGEN